MYELRCTSCGFRLRLSRRADYREQLPRVCPRCDARQPIDGAGRVAALLAASPRRSTSVKAPQR